MRFLLLIPVLLLASCRTAPNWTVSNETARGFDLHAYYGEYAFAPWGSNYWADAKNYFKQSAREAAQQRGKTVSAVALMTMTGGRNSFTGTNSAEMDGRVQYGPEPFSGPVFTDQSEQ